jgi:hypothetical protein
MPLLNATLAERRNMLKAMLLKKHIFSTCYGNFFGGLHTGIKPAVVYLIDLVFVKKKSLAQCPIAVQSGQQIHAKISK